MKLKIVEYTPYFKKSKHKMRMMDETENEKRQTHLLPQEYHRTVVYFYEYRRAYDDTTICMVHAQNAGSSHVPWENHTCGYVPGMCLRILSRRWMHYQVVSCHATIISRGATTSAD